MTPETDNTCICCGQNNPIGLKLAFTFPAPDRARTEVVLPAHFCGWKSLAHGGVLAMLLDEVMAKACIQAGVAGVTAEITVRYLKPVSVGTPLVVTGGITARKRRILHTEGQIAAPDGTVLATATAVFVAQSAPAAG